MNQPDRAIMKQVRYKGAAALEMENDFLRVIILPGLGGKVASLYYKPKEFEAAAQTERRYPERYEAHTLFSEGDSSGLDEAFPTIVASSPEYGDRRFWYPDHGEIWKSAMEYRIDGSGLILTCQSARNPYRYKKELSLRQNELHYHVCIENNSDMDFPCLWAFHGLMRYEPDMRLIFQDTIRCFLNVSDSRELGSADNRFYISEEGIWHCGQRIYDFTRVPPPEVVTELKYYASDEVKRGACGYEYPAQGVRCMLNYDETKLPYLGFWVTAGAYRGDYNCAWEPSNSFYDGIGTAEKNRKLYVLKAGEEVSFSLCLSFEDLNLQTKS